ncbi:unnamed protein product [Rotaria magnacalcarata]
MNENNRLYDLSVLPDDVFTYCGDKFFQLVLTLVGSDIVEILKIQSINSTQSFINTENALSIFQLNIPELSLIKERSCFKLSNGDFVTKIGIENGLKYLTSIIKLKQNEQQARMVGNTNIENRLYDLINRNPLLKSLFSWYDQQQQQEEDNGINQRTFDIFIDR